LLGWASRLRIILVVSEHTHAPTVYAFACADQWWGNAGALRRLPLQDTSKYNERWVQELVHHSPSVLPISVESAFWPAIPVCFPRMVDPLASAKKQKPQPYQKSGGELPRNGGDGDQATGYGYKVPPMIEFGCI
jgi:hypothetical protein